MSTKHVSIGEKYFYYELVTYKAGTEELLEKNLAAKFGKTPVELVFRRGTEIDVGSIVEAAKDDKNLAKTLFKDIENAVIAGMENKLSSIYGATSSEPLSSNPSELSGETPDPAKLPPPPSPHPPTDVAEAYEVFEAGPPGRDPGTPIVYARWHDLNYAYINIAMQRNLWELFSGVDVKFKRIIAGWGEAFKNPQSREKIGKWLNGTSSFLHLGGMAAINWLGNKLQANVDVNRQRKQWKQADKNRKAVMKFDDKEAERRQKELTRVNNGGRYDSFETAADYEGYRSKKRGEVAGRGLERGAVTSAPTAKNPVVDRWFPDKWTGNKKELMKKLKIEFGENIANSTAECGKGSGVKLQILDTVGTRAKALDLVNSYQLKYDTKGIRYFVVAPYEIDNGQIKYVLNADEKTSKWLVDNTPENRYEESMRRGNMQTTKSKISYKRLKKLIMESLAEDNRKKSNIQGLEHYSEAEIKKMVIDQILDRMGDANVTEDEFSIDKIAIFGSRARGNARERSDLNILVGYTGTMREDDAFNVLHDEDYEYGTIDIDGISVDVNPIREEKSGNFEEYLRDAEEYAKK